MHNRDCEFKVGQCSPFFVLPSLEFVKRHHYNISIHITHAVNKERVWVSTVVVSMGHVCSAGWGLTLLVRFIGGVRQVFRYRVCPGNVKRMLSTLGQISKGSSTYL